MNFHENVVLNRKRRKNFVETAAQVSQPFPWKKRWNEKVATEESIIAEKLRALWGNTIYLYIHTKNDSI